MLRTGLWMLSLVMVLTPAAESQTAKPQTKKPAQAPAPAGPAPIATADHEAGDVEVALMEVKRAPGDTVMIKFRYTNKTTASKKLDHGGQGLDAWRFGQDVYFVVPATNQKYTPLTDQNKYPIAAKHEQFGVGIKLAPRQVVNTWAKFPAPPPEVEVITVYLPGAPPFEGVALTK